MCAKFRARKIVLHARPCAWEIVHVKEQTCMTCTLLIITWLGGKNCTKLVLKPLAAKNGLSISVLWIAPFLYITLFQFTWWLLSIFAACTQLVSIYIAALLFLINWKHWSKSNILTMDHDLVLENSSSAAVYTLPNTIIYLN